MKKLYSKVLFTAILFFSYAQAVFAEDFESTIGLVFSPPRKCEVDLKYELIRASFSPSFLFLLIITFFSFLFYFRLRKKNVSKIKSLFLLILGSLCLLLIAFFYFTIFMYSRNPVCI